MDILPERPHGKNSDKNQMISTKEESSTKEEEVADAEMGNGPS